MSIESTLAERGNRYGDFTVHATIAQDVQDAMRRTMGWTALSADKKQALTVIADKIARILSGDPNYADNWHDIQGYAKLVEDRLIVNPIHPATFDHVDPADVEIASAIDDDSERMQAIGQNGEMASEVYAAVDGAPSWDDSPKWAKWLAHDADGKWQWYSLKPTLDDESTEFSPQRNDQWWLADSDECTISADARSGWRSSLQPRPIK